MTAAATQLSILGSNTGALSRDIFAAIKEQHRSPASFPVVFDGDRCAPWYMLTAYNNSLYMLHDCGARLTREQAWEAGSWHQDVLGHPNAGAVFHIDIDEGDIDEGDVIAMGTEASSGWTKQLRCSDLLYRKLETLPVGCQRDQANTVALWFALLLPMVNPWQYDVYARVSTHFNSGRVSRTTCRGAALECLVRRSGL